jgi:hypothetical protein
VPKKGSARSPTEDLFISSGASRTPLCKLDEVEERLSFAFLPAGEADIAWQDCSSLLAMPECAVAFAKALSMMNYDHRRGTADSHVRNLENGFATFCQKNDLASGLRPQDIDTPLINRFVNWLGRTRNDGTYALSAYTRLHLLGVVRSVLATLKEIGTPLAEDCEVPPNPWPLASRGESRQTESEPIATEEVVHFYKHCKDAVAETIRVVEAGWMEEASYRGATQRERERVLAKSVIRRGRVIVKVKEVFGIALPERQQLRKSRHDLFEEIESYGYRRLSTVLAPYAADLCAFVYYLLFVTGFNLQSLVDVRASQVMVSVSMGREVVTIRSLKYRAKTKKHPQGKPIKSSFVVGDDPLSPGRVLKFLLQWTVHMRKAVPGPVTDRLFTFVPRNRSTPGALDTYFQRGNRRSVFDRHTTSFCRKGGFKWVGSRRIRNVVAETVDDLFGGDVQVAATYLHHSRVTTTQEHYQNAAVLARQSRRLAQGMSERERWFQSRGRVEPRNVDRRHDRSAATPGFRCLDPTESPMPAQMKGRLCTAYGDCAACPLAMVDIHNPYAAACLAELKLQFGDRRVHMGAQSFEFRWGESYRALVGVWMPAFPDDVVEQAARLMIPALPELE